MKLAAKILFWVFLIIGTGLYFLTYGMLDNIRTRYLEGVEETLVDQAGILAAMVAQDMSQQRFSARSLHQVFDDAYNRQFRSTIYQLDKTGVDLRVYITDEKGLIVFDSVRKAFPGEDYSKWRDVYLTLRGKYGARSSREDETLQSSSVLYVAAPILVDTRIRGVLTVAKPTTSINSFLAMAQAQLKVKITVTVGLIIVLSVLAIIQITRPVKALTVYANRVRAGKKAVLPRLDSTEIGDMGRAFENMRISLENRKYVETYVQTLTHEIKSPLSAIKGAAELLEEEMPPEQKARFLGNIHNEAQRIKHLVDRLPELASLETMKSLETIEPVDFSLLLAGVLDQMQPVMEARPVTITRDIGTTPAVKGDPLLLKLAVSNLVQNSADFSPPNGVIHVSLSENNGVLLKIMDQGPGIPGYAAEKIFDKFFSLQRPGSGKKSTGIGLNLVKEIIDLHQGSVALENLPDGGVCATLFIP